MRSVFILIILVLIFCATTLAQTEQTFPCGLVTLRKTDEFSIAANRIDKARIDNFLMDLQYDPNAVAYIIEKFALKTSGDAKKLKIQKLTDYLFRVKKIKKDRIIIWSANSSKTLTQFFIVPAGAKPPTCDDCII